MDRYGIKWTELKPTKTDKNQTETDRNQQKATDMDLMDKMFINRHKQTKIVKPSLVKFSNV